MGNKITVSIDISFLSNILPDDSFTIINTYGGYFKYIQGMLKDMKITLDDKEAVLTGVKVEALKNNSE